jgi:hypothetical protein
MVLMGSREREKKILEIMEKTNLQINDES